MSNTRCKAVIYVTQTLQTWAGKNRTTPLDRDRQWTFHSPERLGVRRIQSSEVTCRPPFSKFTRLGSVMNGTSAGFTKAMSARTFEYTYILLEKACGKPFCVNKFIVKTTAKSGRTKHKHASQNRVPWKPATVCCCHCIEAV